MDCAFCKHFKWEKKKMKPSNKIFDVPICRLKNIELTSPDLAKECDDYNCKFFRGDTYE